MIVLFLFRIKHYWININQKLVCSEMTMMMMFNVLYCQTFGHKHGGTIYGFLFTSDIINNLLVGALSRLGLHYRAMNRNWRKIQNDVVT